MAVQEILVDSLETQSPIRFIPLQKMSRSDVYFPLTSPARKRASSIVSITDHVDHEASRTLGRLTLQARGSPTQELPHSQQDIKFRVRKSQSQTSLQDLPLEVQGKVLDYIFGAVHSVGSTTGTSGSSVSSLMRHPRRKAVSELALVSPSWRDLVQERIYRHIKIKGTRAGLEDSKEYFDSHYHLTKHVRHVEFWVPVWGDKASLSNHSLESPMNNRHNFFSSNNNLMTTNDLLGFNFKLSVYSATLSQIFRHIAEFFPDARIFTLEGGHCKNSHMIRHFPSTLFPNPNQSLRVLPNVRTFVMRGAWNIMREYSHWQNIQSALPNLEEWHCGYAKSSLEANSTIYSVLRSLPLTLRHLNITLDGMYSKDSSTLSSHASSTSFSPHLCSSLGALAPSLDSFSFTGRICSDFFTSALSRLTRASDPRLHTLELTVKSCCRRIPLPVVDPLTGDSDPLADHTYTDAVEHASITNLAFVRSFEHLVLSAISALPHFPHLHTLRIRFIDLDSPCTLLNPYWILHNNTVHGLWNEDMVACLAAARPEASYEVLEDGLGSGWGKDDEPGGGLYPKVRPRSIKSSSYRVLAEARSG